MSDSIDNDIGSNDWVSSGDWYDEEFEVETTDEFDDESRGKAQFLRRLVAAKYRQTTISPPVDCAECGQQNKAHHKFCHGCGAAIITPDKQSEPAQKVRRTSPSPPPQNQMRTPEAQ